MIFIRLIFFIFFLPFFANAEENAAKVAVEKVANSISDGISNTFNSLTSFDGIESAELEIDSKDRDFVSDIRASIIASLSESESGSFVLNQSNLSIQDETTTFNTGLLVRTLSDEKKWMRGLNIFYDHEFPENHQRASIGIEAKSTPLEFNSNYYQRISGDKTVGSTSERAMDGVDVEVGFQLPYLPSSKLFLAGYEWYGKDYDIKSGNKVSLRVRPSSALEIEIGAQDDDQESDHRATAKIIFKKKFGDKQEDNNKFFSNKAFEFQDMSNEVYEKVRRQNRIVKTVTGTVSVGRGT